MLLSSLLELTVGLWSVYIGIIAYGKGHLFGLPSVIYASLAVLLTLQNFLTLYNSSKTQNSRIYEIYLMVMKFIAMLGMVIGLVMGVLSCIEYGESINTNQPLFDALWALVTVGWSWLILGRLSEMQNVNEEDDTSLEKESNKKNREFYDII